MGCGTGPTYAPREVTVVVRNIWLRPQVVIRISGYGAEAASADGTELLLNHGCEFASYRRGKTTVLESCNGRVTGWSENGRFVDILGKDGIGELRDLATGAVTVSGSGYRGWMLSAISAVCREAPICNPRQLVVSNDGKREVFIASGDDAAGAYFADVASHEVSQVDPKLSKHTEGSVELAEVLGPQLSADGRAVLFSVLEQDSKRVDRYSIFLRRVV